MWLLSEPGDLGLDPGSTSDQGVCCGRLPPVKGGQQWNVTRSAVGIR